jgi:phosphoribosylglycinamide formyltransferase-1
MKEGKKREMSLKIGWLTSGEDLNSQKLFTNLHKALQDLKLDVDISYLFSNQQLGKAQKIDQFFTTVRDLGVHLITLPSAEFQKKVNPCQTEKESPHWQEEYHRLVMEKISSYPVDIILLVDYPVAASIEFINTYNIAKFRTALPGGPTGDRTTTIWQLIGTRAMESGMSLSLLNEYDPIYGVPLTYCSYSIRGDEFAPLWCDLDQKMKSQYLKQIMETEGEGNSLFKAIKEAGEKWEQPLLNLTIQYLSTGEISIKDKLVYSGDKIQLEGHCLTEEIRETYFDKTIKGSEEGA